MTAQPIDNRLALVPDPYDKALAERIVLGRLYMDYLSHLRLTAPQAVLLFRRVLDLDARLSKDDRYDHDHLEIVAPREDARFHQPPETPADHTVSPCRLCRRQRLGLDVDVVLPVALRRSA